LSRHRTRLAAAPRKAQGEVQEAQGAQGAHAAPRASVRTSAGHGEVISGAGAEVPVLEAGSDSRDEAGAITSGPNSADEAGVITSEAGAVSRGSGATARPLSGARPLLLRAPITRKDKVSFITGDLELDPGMSWPKVIEAAEAIGLTVGSGGNLGSKIDRLYKQLA